MIGKFIKLHEESNGHALLLDVGTIKAFRETYYFVNVFLTDGSVVSVEESIDQICEMLGASPFPVATTDEEIQHVGYDDAQCGRDK